MLRLRAEHITILDRLYRSKTIGEKHTAIEELSKGVRSDLKGAMADAAKDLLKEGYLMPKHAGYGQHVSLNPYRIKEIAKILEDQ